MTLRVTFDLDACALKVLEIYICSVSFANKNLLEKEKKKNMTKCHASSCILQAEERHWPGFELRLNVGCRFLSEYLTARAP